MHNHFQLAQQCIQISTRINSSSVHMYIFVCFTLRIILQGFVDPKMQHPEYSGNTSDTSIDTQAARTIQAVSVTADPEPGGAIASTSAGQDTHRVELTPLLGLTQQFAIQVEWEIQKQIQERSRQLVQDVLQRSANRIMPPDPFGGGTGLPQSVLPKSFGHTPD